MNRPIFIEYETKTREFDGRLLLISNLLNKGASTVFFGTKSGIHREIQNHTNGIFIAKSFSMDGKTYYKELKRKNFSIILLHVEGGILYKDMEDVIVSYFPKELLSLTSLNFVYGQKIKDGIKKFIGSQEIIKKTVVSGEPRFDLLKPKYERFFKTQVSQILEKFGEFILINTSFSTANPYAGEDRIREFFSNEETYSDEVKKRLIFKIDFLKEVLNEYLDAIETLSNLDKTRSFVIRPHPSESKKLYEDRFRKIENVYVDNSGNVVSWIHACKGVIHYDCTTGMEASLAKKPVISYLPKYNEKVVAWLPIALSCRTTNQKDLAEKVNSILTDDFKFDIPNDIMHDWQGIIHNVKHESSEIIADKILEMQYVYIENEPLMKINPQLIFIRIKKYFSYVVKSYLIKKPVSIIKSGSISKKEIRSKLTLLNQIHNFDYSFKLNYQGHDVVRIQKRSS
jgi:surface carbohydrate biosynthesis protein